MTDRPAGAGALTAYLSLLSFHVAHILEEILGRFIVLRKLGLVRFAAVNGVLFCVPVIFFYFWLRGRRWASRMSAIYAGFMVLNGLGHNIMTLATGRYFDGYAGGYSGIGLALSGAFLLRFLLPESGRSVRSRGSGFLTDHNVPVGADFQDTENKRVGWDR